MIYYYDKNGHLIKRTNNVREMCEYTGYTRKRLLARIQERERNKLKRGADYNTVSSYFERDPLDDTTATGMNNHFLRMYFSGATNEDIMDEMDIDERKLYRMYKHLIGIDLEPSEPVSIKSKDGIKPDFWKEWKEVTTSLLNSGADLRIPITFKHGTT